MFVRRRAAVSNLFNEGGDDVSERCVHTTNTGTRQDDIFDDIMTDWGKCLNDVGASVHQTERLEHTRQ